MSHWGLLSRLHEKARGASSSRVHSTQTRREKAGRETTTSGLPTPGDLAMEGPPIPDRSDGSDPNVSGCVQYKFENDKNEILRGYRMARSLVFKV